MKPQIIDKATFAFPANVRHLIPFDEEGFKDYRKNWTNSSSWGIKLFETWFFSGIK